MTPIPDIDGELWLPLRGLEEKYEISNYGRIKSYSKFGKLPAQGVNAHLKNLHPGRLMATFTRKRFAYSGVNLSGYDGRQISANVHVLVLETFCEPRPPGMVARHLNGDPRCNHLSNLKWGTPQENSDDRILHGTVPHGARHPNAKLSDEKARIIRASPETTAALARRFGVGYTTINNVRMGKTWRFA